MFVVACHHFEIPVGAMERAGDKKQHAKHSVDPE